MAGSDPDFDSCRFSEAAAEPLFALKPGGRSPEALIAVVLSVALSTADEQSTSAPLPRALKKSPSTPRPLSGRAAARVPARYEPHVDLRRLHNSPYVDRSGTSKTTRRPPTTTTSATTRQPGAT